MIDKFEQYKILTYVNNLLKNTDSSILLFKVCEFIEGYPSLFGTNDDTGAELISYLGLDAHIFRKQYRKIKKTISMSLKDAENSLKDSNPSYIENNIQILTNELMFNEIETDIFSLLVRNNINYTLKRLLSIILEIITISPLDV